MIPILSCCALLIDRTPYGSHCPQRRHAAEEATREDAECIRALAKTEKLREAVDRERRRRDDDRPERNARQTDAREKDRSDQEPRADREAARADGHRLSPQVERP